MANVESFTTKSSLFNTLQSETITTPSIGDRIGDCILEHVIKEGAASIIFKARHIHLDVPRVIKILKPLKYTRISNVTISRFFNEARIIASIKHPNIVCCYNFGLSHCSLPYMELEYIDGVDLRYWLQFLPRIPKTVTLSILSNVCDALLELHTCEYTFYGDKRRGIVHRNLMPDNIMVSLEGEVKLIDFGFAKAERLSLHPFQIVPIGDCSYMSPEQMKCEKVDTRADIYSLGCILYEMLTGNKAFCQKNLEDLLDQKCREEMDNYTIGRLPHQLEQIILRCLKRSPFDRFATMHELRNELNLLLSKYRIQNPRQVIRDFRGNYRGYREPKMKTKVSKHHLLLASTILNLALVLSLAFVLYQLYIRRALDLIRGY